MKEKPFRATEQESGNVRRLEKGASTGWEGERVFTVEEAVAVITELDPNAAGIRVTDQLVSHEGVLLSMSARAPDQASGYSYILKGNHGGSFRARTVIDRIDYAGPDSEQVVFAEEIAVYQNGTWVRV